MIVRDTKTTPQQRHRKFAATLRRNHEVSGHAQHEDDEVHEDEEVAHPDVLHEVVLERRRRIRPVGGVVGVYHR